MRHFHAKLIGLCLASSLILGCTIVHYSNRDTVRIVTTPFGANCIARNSLGKWYLHHTPGEMVIKRDYDILYVTCRKPGFQRVRKQLTPTADDYPEEIHITLKPQKADA